METDIEFSSHESEDDFGYVRDKIESGSTDHYDFIQEYIKGIDEAGSSDAFF